MLPEPACWEACATYVGNRRGSSISLDNELLSFRPRVKAVAFAQSFGQQNAADNLRE